MNRGRTIEEAQALVRRMLYRRGVATTSQRWRAFADVVALSLGVNVWFSVVLLPAMFVGAMHGASGVVVGAIPLLVLIVGILRRSEVALLLAFPATILLPIGLAPQIASSEVYGPVRFVIVTFGVLAYLFGIAFFTTFHEPPPPVSTRALASSKAGPPSRWRRRERVYWGLVVLAVVFPGAMIAWVNFDSGIQAYLGQMYPGRVALMTTMLDAAALALWLAIYHFAFLGVLRPHRTGDRDLLVAIGHAKADLRRGKPRRRFYLGVFAALLAMAALLALRHLL